jgi:hypothetical protein
MKPVLFGEILNLKLRLSLQVLPPARALGCTPAAPRPPQVLHPFMFHQLMHVSSKKIHHVSLGVVIDHSAALI